MILLYKPVLYYTMVLCRESHTFLHVANEVIIYCPDITPHVVLCSQKNLYFSVYVAEKLNICVLTLNPFK